MPVYNKDGLTLQNVYDKEGVEIPAAYNASGTQIFPDDPIDDSILTSFEMFYPNDASGEYEVADFNTFNMTTDQFLALKYDDYLTNPPNGITVTKTSIGKDSTGQYDIWEYAFTPQNPSRKILLASGEHAYEITAQFGLAHFIDHVYRIKDNDAFAYIRQNVDVRVVPIFNPWGCNQYPRTYGVYGGINPERNFNYNGLWEQFTASGNMWNKKGDYPFQTAETRTMAKWCMDNQNADYFLNCHTSEDNSAYDLWVDYMNDTYAVSAILAALDKNKVEFATKFGRTARVNQVSTSYPNNTGYGMHGMWNIRCNLATGFTVEQPAHNTIWGNGKSCSAGAINNYAAILSTYVLEMLLNKYQSIYDAIHPTDAKPITAVSGQNVSLTSSDYSTTVTLAMTPSDTTQFTFDWVSSDASVCEVWGCTDQAVIVKRGTGTATITVTNRLNPSVHTSFTVTVS